MFRTSSMHVHVAAVKLFEEYLKSFEFPCSKQLRKPDHGSMQVWGRPKGTNSGGHQQGGQPDGAHGGFPQNKDPAQVGRQFLAGRLAVRTWW